ncbi:uncharacterized protein LOC120499963 [Passer montanus]|uniref:uncharacterized protein LOC120499963 n=1 Tax=Passer montanus TaxID=9160 RepID=UPI001960010F|nr:uncharacterized protein LOC120499963 [Passer montanus]
MPDRRCSSRAPGAPGPFASSLLSAKETGSPQSSRSEVCASKEFPARLFLEALQKCGSLGDSAAGCALGERRQPRHGTARHGTGGSSPGAGLQTRPERLLVPGRRFGAPRAVLGLPGLREGGRGRSVSLLRVCPGRLRARCAAAPRVPRALPTLWVGAVAPSSRQGMSSARTGHAFPRAFPGSRRWEAEDGRILIRKCQRRGSFSGKCLQRAAAGAAAPLGLLRFLCSLRGCISRKITAGDRTPGKTRISPGFDSLRGEWRP